MFSQNLGADPVQLGRTHAGTHSSGHLVQSLPDNSSNNPQLVEFRMRLDGHVKLFYTPAWHRRRSWLFWLQVSSCCGTWRLGSSQSIRATHGRPPTRPSRLVSSKIGSGP